MLKKIAGFLKKQKEVCIITHTNPDGDALGSSFALKYALEKAGVRAEVTLGAPLPKQFEFTGWQPAEKSSAKCVAGVDFGDISRTPCAELFEKAEKTVIVDHHIIKSEMGDMFFSNPNAAAAGELVYELISYMGTEMDEKIASALYIAIMTDTGGCRFGNTTRKTHLILADLIDYVDNAYINRMVFDVMSREKFEARRILFNNMETYCGGRLNVFAAGAEFKNEDALNGLVNVAVNMEGAAAGAVFKQRGENVVKVSLRTVGGLNAAEICAHFDGGGHANAAGCTIYADLNTAKNEFVKYISQRIEEG